MGSHDRMGRVGIDNGKVGISWHDNETHKLGTKGSWHEDELHKVGATLIVSTMSSNAV